MRAYPEAIARDDARGLAVRFASSADDIAAAVDLLDRVEGRCRAPLVDEAERARLDHVVERDLDKHEHWHPLLAWPADAGPGPHDAGPGQDHPARPVGYAGLSLTGERPTADVVVPELDVLPVLLDALRDLSGQHGAPIMQAWLRHVDPAVLDVAGLVGWELERRLLVLRRDLVGAPLVRPPFPPGFELRTHDGSDADDEGVARVLAAAYAGTPNDGWTASDVASRRDYDWFRPDDLLVAVRDSRILGLHWTKRRDHRSGEVYNLAVHPDAQGLGLGASLLDAGLEHLADLGCEQVLLWVEESNHGARRLYDSRGFEAAWDDVALRCAVCLPEARTA